MAIAYKPTRSAIWIRGSNDCWIGWADRSRRRTPRPTQPLRRSPARKTRRNQKLRREARAAPHDAPMVLKPGAVLSREWRGRMERVTAMEEGFSWNGKSYSSLSAAAFAITGVKWNGPRFFFGSMGRGKAGARPGAKPSQTATSPPAAARLQPCPDSRSGVRPEP